MFTRHVDLTYNNSVTDIYQNVKDNLDKKAESLDSLNLQQLQKQTSSSESFFKKQINSTRTSSLKISQRTNSKNNTSVLFRNGLNFAHETSIKFPNENYDDDVSFGNMNTNVHMLQLAKCSEASNVDLGSDSIQLDIQNKKYFDQKEVFSSTNTNEASEVSLIGSDRNLDSKSKTKILTLFKKFKLPKVGKLKSKKGPNFSKLRSYHDADNNLEVKLNLTK